MNPLTRLPDSAQLHRPGLQTRLLAFFIVVVLPLIITSFDPNLGKQARFGGAYASFAAIALVVMVIWLALDWLLRRQHLSLTREGLQITSSFYRRTLPLSALQLDNARVINLDEHVDYKPRLKTNGTSLPGLKSGWFRLRNGNKALVAIYNNHKALWIPTSAGYDLLLQPRSPQQLLDHLRELADSVRTA